MQLDEKFDKLEYYEIEVSSTEKWKWAYSCKAFRAHLSREFKNKRIKRIFVELESYLWSVGSRNSLDCTTEGGRIIVLFDDKALMLYVYSKGVFKYRIISADDIVGHNYPIFDHPPKYLSYIRQCFYRDIKDCFDLSYDECDVVKINVSGTRSWVEVNGFDEVKAEKYAKDAMLPEGVSFALENGSVLDIVGDECEYFSINITPRSFCDEAIEGISFFAMAGHGEGFALPYYLHMYNCFECHTVNYAGFIFQTKSRRIIVSSDGVCKCDSTESIKADVSAISDDEPLSCMLIGRKLTRFDVLDSKIILYFSDTEMAVCFHSIPSEVDFLGSMTARGINKASCGNYLLKKNCVCEGKGEIFFNNKSEYSVRCSSCHKATKFYYRFSDAIRSWNNQLLDTEFETDMERFADIMYDDPIVECIILHDKALRNVSDREAICESVSVVIQNKAYTVSSYKSIGNTWDFTLNEEDTACVKPFGSRVLPHSRLSFMRLTEDNDKSPVIRFALDDCDLDISATSEGIRVYLSKIEIYDIKGVKKRKRLFE